MKADSLEGQKEHEEDLITLFYYLKKGEILHRNEILSEQGVLCYSSPSQLF